MKKKKGFTLIELLAVIVILAIIALIATPIVLNLIKSAKKGSFVRSAEGLLQSSKIYYSLSFLNTDNQKTLVFNCSNNECTSDELDINGNNKKLDFDGNVGYGKVTIDENGKISFDITDNVYCAYKYANNEKIYVVDGTCDENNIDIVHDTSLPTIIQTDIIITPYTITVNYETSDDIEVKEVVCSYGDSQDKLDKKGTANLTTCLMDNLLSSNDYYYKICAIDNGLNVSNPCIEGKARTKAAISGTPTIVASWPDTTSIKVDISGMTIDESDTVSYRYSVNGEVKQDWTTDSSYTYIGLTEGTSNTILVETKATNGGDLGNTKEAEIWTSKTVIFAGENYNTQDECNSSYKMVDETDIYTSIRLNSTCEEKFNSKSCTKTLTNQSSCSSTTTCTIDGVSGIIGNLNAKETGRRCSTSEPTDCSYSVCHDDEPSCGYTSTGEFHVYGSCEPSDHSGWFFEPNCHYNSEGTSYCCANITCYCTCDYECVDYDYTYSCSYSGDVNVPYYTSSYSGIVKPKKELY